MAGIAADLISTAEAARLAAPDPLTGRPMTVGTIRYWMDHGIRTPTGTVKLAFTVVSGRHLTTRAALAEFTRAVRAAYASTPEEAAA